MELKVTVLSWQEKQSKKEGGQPYGLIQCVIHDDVVTAGPVGMYGDEWAAFKDQIRAGEYTGTFRLQPSGFSCETRIEKLVPMKSSAPVSSGSSAKSAPQPA